MSQPSNDNGGVFVDRLTASRNGREMDLQVLAHLVIRDGKIVEGFDYFFDTHLWDAFWAE